MNHNRTRLLKTFRKVAVIFQLKQCINDIIHRYCTLQETFVQDTHTIRISLYSIPKFTKSTFDSLMISNKQSNYYSYEFKIHSSNRKRINLPYYFHCNSIKKTNEITILGYNGNEKLIYTYIHNKGYFLLSISILPLTRVFIHFRQDQQREINYRRKKEPRG